MKTKLYRVEKPQAAVTHLFLAQFESRNFLFEGVGVTANSAKAALLRVLVIHCERTGASLADFYSNDDVHVRELAAGQLFIDRERVTELA